MRNKIVRNWMLQAAVSAALGCVGAGVGLAQVRDTSDGRALDANNRVGSNGYNAAAGGGGGSNFYTSQQIVTGNVTGGRSFRGPVPYSDPRAFRGATVGNISDTFVRDSSGVSNGTTSGLESPTAFYGRSRAVAPPDGFQREGFTGGYLNRSGNAFASNYSNNGQTSYDSYAIDDPFSARMRERLVSVPTQANDPAQQANGAMLITASPLYGVRQWNNTERGAQDFINPRGAADSVERSGFGLDPIAVERMRNEINQNGLPADRADNQQPGQPGDVNDATGGNRSDPARGQPLISPLNSTPDGANGGGDTGPGDTGQAAQPLNGSTLGSAGVRSRLVVPAGQQSQLYRELVKRYDRQQQNQPLTPEQSARQLNALRRAQGGQPGQDTGTAAQPGPTALQPGVGPGGLANGLPAGGQISPLPVPGELPPRRDGRPNTPDETMRPRVPVPATTGPSTPTLPPNTPAEPLKVTSLAQGIAAPGLRDLMVSAESLLKEGKFDSAIEKYDAAALVAVENPLITLGRAQAELAATYYRRAENDLRRAIGQEPALLKGEYDLKTFLGDERLRYVVQDLKALAEREPKDTRSLLLLAYIAYNTGMAEQAGSFLNQADERAGGNDATIRQMRSVWSLPSGQPASQGTVPPPPAEDSTPATDLNK